MSSITAETIVAAPREKVFEFCTDIPRAAERISGIERVEMLTDGPVGEGTRWRETRVIMNREATEELEITRFDPPRSYEVGCQAHGTDYLTTFEFEEVEGGTRVELVFEGRPKSLSAKLLSPLSGLMKNTMRKCLEEDLRDIRTACESASEEVG